ncbi:uncharacterized protein LOC111302082 isoform X1 [Durio zibethinus]|uniref:Uncharacterized protein LOC111302082 isoform X1 n=1 Tax=Durio zibethinus TaxID=66656 RepID=A0A6P5ZMI8_DURZI|nr:uncharacterized protein LOC111302082 isoform X1 [Durio zibethinus]
MVTGLIIKSISFKQLGLGVLFLLLSLQLHLLLALPQNSMDAVPKKLSLAVQLGGKHEIKAVGRRGGGGGDPHGSAGGAAGDNVGGTKSPDGQGGAVIPVYAAGAVNHNRYHHSSGTRSINCIGSSCLVLTLFTSFFFVYSM